MKDGRERSMPRLGTRREPGMLRELRPPSFADLLRRHRVDAGLTQEELAERAALSARAISDLERGLKTRPQRETIRLLAEALGLNTEERNRLSAAARPPESAPPPPVRPSPVPLGNLPAPPTPLLGREAAVASAVARLRHPDVRLLTITGPGGIGKSRLALAVAEHLRPDFPDGVFFVPLAALDDPALVPAAIAKPLGIAEQGIGPLRDTVLDVLRTRRLLMLLDNFEHLTPAVALLDEILASAPRVCVLATSRMALNSPWAHDEPLSPLALPPDGATDPALIARAPTVALFLARAVAVRPDIHLTEDNASAMVAICRRLDGLPLAIELAAARTRLLSPPAILARLDRPLHLLTRGIAGRQGALRDTIAWSYDLLSPDEQRLFRRLTVFAGGCTIAAAEAVCAEPGALSETLDLAESLVVQSLVLRDDTPDGELRLSFFETIREYGQEVLEEADEAEVTRDRHAAYHLALVEEAAPHLMSAAQGVWLVRLEAETENLRSALRHYLNRGDAPSALRLSGGLWRYWYLRGQFGEGRRWLKAALALSCDEAVDTITAARALALYGASSLAGLQRDLTEAEALGEASLAIRRRLGDQAGVAGVLHTLAYLAREAGDLARADARNQESLAIKRALGDSWGISASLNNLGTIAGARGDFRRAAEYYEESLAIKREIGDRQGLALALNNLAEIVGHLHGPAAARPHFTESLALARAVGSRLDEALALDSLGDTAGQSGDYAQAAALQAEAVAIYREIGARAGLASSLTNLGESLHQLGDDVQAAALHEESLAIARAASDRWATAIALTNCGRLALARGEVATAVTHCEEALALFLALEDGWETILTLNSLARAVLEVGDRDRADALWRDALGRAVATGTRDYLAPALEGLAALAVTIDPDRAARLFGAAASLRALLGIPLPPIDRAAHDQALATLRTVLGEADFIATYNAGTALTPEEAIALAAIPCSPA